MQALSNITLTPNEFAELILKEKARRNYLDYCYYVHHGVWKPFSMHKLICAKLEDIFWGRSKRVIFQMPPRHGKSMTVTETFPSYYMEKWASMGVKKNVIQVSYSGDLAEDFGAKNRDKVEEFGKELFGIGLDPRQKTKAKWSLENGATMVSVGIGGPITGKGANLLIIDDPIKNHEEAESETYREKVWNEWRATLRTRLTSDAAVIVIQTRWHEDDLAGRLIKTGKWEVVSLPAICDSEDDLLGRKIGEPLCPELGFDAKWAEETKHDVGSRAWEALYQQRPTAAEGNIFKRQWFRFYRQSDLPTSFDEITQSWDMSFKDTEKSDYVACGVWGRKGANHYLLYALKERLDFVATIQKFIQVSKMFPQATLKLVEEKANGAAVISMLRKKIPGIVAVNPTESKEARAYAVTPLFEAGNVFIPEDAAWKDEYIEELVSFPNGKHDDQVDQTTQYLRRHIAPSERININTQMFDLDDDWTFF